MLRAVCAVVMLGSLFATASTMAEDAVPVWELRVYTCEPGKLDALHSRFREHTMRIFEKHGMENVAYWTPVDGPASETTLVYLLKHSSRAAATASWDGFRNDPEWKKVAADSAAAHGKILAKPPEVTFLAATDYSPEVKTIPEDAAFELRTYTTNAGKLGNLNTRFRDHTLGLFAKYGMTNLWYGVPQDQERSENTLIYFLAHRNRDAAAESWKGFLADPDWQAVHKASEADGPILAKSPDSMFLKLTDYSPRASAASTTAE